MSAGLPLADGARYAGLFADFNTTFWSGALRVAEAVVASAPFLVAGVLAAGFLRGVVGAGRIRRLLGVGHWSGPLRAWAFGVLLPICSLGALPVARELRRAGVPSGTVLSFVLVAPVLNPISVIYGLAEIVPGTLLYFAAGTFVVSVGIGAVWNRLVSGGRDVVPETSELAPRTGVGRLAVAGETAAKSLVGPAAVDYGLALLAVGLLGAFLPHGVLQTGLTRDNPLSPVIMGLVAIPAYVTPIEVMMHFAHIVQDGYSLGAAFALIVLGAGANVGVANWLRRDYGLKPLLLFVGLLIGSTLVIGVTADRAIAGGTADMKDHTHAFDPFTRLSQVTSDQAGFGWVVGTVRRDIEQDEASGTARVVGLAMLLVIAAAGVLLRLLGDRVDARRWADARDPRDAAAAGSGLNRSLTAGQLAGVAVVGVLAAAGVGLYLFYPPADDLFEEMSTIRPDAYSAVREGDAAEASRRFEQWRSQLQKLPTSVLLRTGSVSDAQRAAVDDLLYAIKTVEDAAAAGRTQEARMLVRFAEDAYADCREAFRDARD